MANLRGSRICQEGEATLITFKICPQIKKSLQDYCKESGLLKSWIINEAIKSYLERNKNVQV